MNSADLIQQLLTFVSTELVGKHKASDLEADEDLLGSGLVDSLGVMRLVRFIEDSFDVSVPHGDITIENFMTARMIAGYLGSRGVGDGTLRAD